MSVGGAVGPKPRERDPERRRQAILGAAAEIALEQGTAALTHRAVAARAGVALGSTTRYFTSIEDLRGATLQMLGEELDASLDLIEQELSSCDDLPERMGALVHEFLCDPRQVRASMALVAAAVSDSTLRSLASRWTDRLTGILAQYTDTESALAAETYLNGAMMHAAFHDTPLGQDAVTRAFRALLAISETEDH